MKQFRIFALFLALLLLVTGCSLGSGRDSQSEEDSVADQNFPVEVGGVKLRQKPETVVSLSPSLTELCGELGFAGRLGGVSDYCAADGGLPQVGTVNQPDLSAIERIAPQVVIAVSPLSETDLQRLQQSNISVVVIPRAESPDQLERLYADVGRVFEGKEDGARLGEDLFREQMDRLDALRGKLEAAGDEPLEAVYLRLFPLTMATGDTFEGRMLEAAGFANGAAEYTDWTYPQDQAVNLMPDVVFVDRSVGLDALKNSQIYNTTPAYANNRCFEYDLEAFERQGGAMFDLLEQMARDACPSAFPAESAPVPEESSADEVPELSEG